jgi:predicted metal-dependent phosphoesterase TrpH/glycosyltransferase involved in cell wall biosynthesis
VSEQSLTIAQVTPHSWGRSHEVNEFVERVSGELASRGHRVLIAAPSDSRAAIREGRRLIKAARDDPAALFPERGSPTVVCVGQGLPLPRGPGSRSAPLPIDVSRSLETLLGSAPIDIVHVHEPFAPSTSAVALRHSHSLNVGTFHDPAERLISTQVARPLIEIFFGRLDARTASSGVTAELLDRYFPGAYELVTPGADAEPRGRRRGGQLRILYCAEEERGALRLFLRALRRLPLELDWSATVWAPDPNDPLIRIGRRLRDRVELVGPADGPIEEFVAASDVLCAASGGPDPAPGLIRKALAGGAVPVASHLDLYSELTGDGERGLLFPPGDAETLAGQLERLADGSGLRTELRAKAAGPGAPRGWKQVADEVEAIYRRIAARRHDPKGDAALRRKLSSRPQIDIDLHMHTDHSPDCATPVQVLLETARDRGLGAIAITDHNEISGALEARDAAAEMDGLKVIVAEEVKTAEQGEVIGLFLEKKIPRGMTMAETIAAIKEQGGIVYMPHPFDRFHSVPDYEHLLDVVEDIDILEIFNPRVALTAFNEEAVRFADKYRIVPGAGSDSHVAQGLGSVRIRVHDFDGPQEFLQAMRDADIVHKHKNLVYVQALKFLQTAGRPKAPKRKVANAKPVRGGQRQARRAGSRSRSKS